MCHLQQDRFGTRGERCQVVRRVPNSERIDRQSMSAVRVKFATNSQNSCVIESVCTAVFVKLRRSESESARKRCKSIDICKVIRRKRSCSSERKRFDRVQRNSRSLPYT